MVQLSDTDQCTTLSCTLLQKTPQNLPVQVQLFNLATAHVSDYRQSIVNLSNIMNDSPRDYSSSSSSSNSSTSARVSAKLTSCLTLSR